MYDRLRLLKARKKISEIFPMNSSEPVVWGHEPIIGHDPYFDPIFKSGLYSTGPTVYGPHDQHNSGHLQLAQHLTGVMSQSSSSLTVFGPSALHFYSGLPQSTASLLLFGSQLPAPVLVSPQQQVRSIS
jgi:hypothetical protein